MLAAVPRLNAAGKVINARCCIMMRILVLLSIVVAGGVQAAIVTNSWQALFKGIEHISATNYPDAAIPRLQVVHCLRVDLADPDIQFLATPPASNPVARARETLSLTITNFLRDYHVQIAVNANFYNPGDPPGEGFPVLFGHEQQLWIRSHVKRVFRKTECLLVHAHR